MDETRYLKRKQKSIQVGNRDQLAICCHNLAGYYNEQGRYEDAIEEYRQEAEIYRKLDKRLAMAKAHRMVGEMHMLLSQFDTAKEHINIYLRTVTKLQNKVEEQRAYATLGRAHLLHGQSCSSNETSASATLTELKQAERAFLRSLLLIKELTGQISKVEQLDMQARCYLNIGVVKEHMDAFNESIAYIEKAIKISKSHDIFELTHLCYISMSLLYYCKKNDSTLALRYCNLALEVAKRLPNKVKKICETLMTKAEILIKEGDFASAKQMLTKAYKKNSPDENDRVAIEKLLRIVVKICQILDELVTTSSVDFAHRKTLYEKLGDGCCHLQSYVRAIEFYKQTLECAELAGAPAQEVIPIYVSLYQTYKDNKQYDKALDYLWKEYELNKDVAEEACSTLCFVAEIYELQLQPFWTVQDIYQRAKEQAAKAGSATDKLERTVYARQRRLQLKHKMNLLAEELTLEAKNKGIDLEADSDEADGDSLGVACDMEQNTPQLGDDVCLDDLTSTDTSDLDESEKVRVQRSTRGSRCLTIKRNNKGETQLHQACIAGNVELARRLLDQGHAVNVRDHAGWMPLHEACNHGHRDIVELLLDRGGALALNDKGGTSCDGITPLYDACANGYLDVVELLLEHGADATVRTDFGETCVDGLDKWRRTATLTDGEQAQYAQVRATLQKPLAQRGSGQCGARLTPLNNSHVRPTDTDDDEAALLDGNVPAPPGAGVLKDSNKSSARAEYRHVMEQLKRRNRGSAIDTDLSGSSGSCAGVKQSKRSAFLDTAEVDDIDWLIDDVGPEKKKRRFCMPTIDAVVRPTHTTTTTTTQSPARRVPSKESLYDSANSTWDEHLEELATPIPEADAFELLREAAGASSASLRQRPARKLRLSRTSSSTSSSSGGGLSTGNRASHRPKYQASLLDSGFCRFRSESPVSSEDSRDANAVAQVPCASEPDSHRPLVSPAKQSGSVLVPTFSFKVKVEDELLLVPVERKRLQEINMRWLADEAARRYYNLVGLRPVLRLKTPDGFAYEESDSVMVAMEQNMILASVLDWQIAPLGQRYEEMCQQLQKDINTEVHGLLERAHASKIIRLDDLWLTPPLTEPIFKAIQHQSTLQVLDLPNNFLQNEGCRQLARSLPTLKQLKTLNLKGNFISADGLDVLLNCAASNMPLQLEELNLSQNPLGNASVRIIASFCRTAGGALKKLLLSHCHLSELYNFDLCYNQLIAFDISHNHLDDEAVQQLLSKLNSCRLQHVDLGYCSASNAINNERLVAFFESGTCEKFRRVALGGCGLSDASVYRMIQCLCKASDLEAVDVADNTNLTAVSLHFMLEKLPRLRKLVAVNCPNFMDEERVQKLNQLQHWPNFLSLTVNNASDAERLDSMWRAHWRDKAHVRTCKDANHLLLYVNDEDVTNVV